jgi:hypothetical protein
MNFQQNVFQQEAAINTQVSDKRMKLLERLEGEIGKLDNGGGGNGNGNGNGAAKPKFPPRNTNKLY